MGLRTDIQTDVASALDTDLLDVTTAITYRQVSSTYTPVTGNVDVNTDESSRAVFYQISQSLVDNEAILSSDKTALILQNELTATPVINDTIIDGTDSYKVVRILNDPADATWELVVRLNNV